MARRNKRNRAKVPDEVLQYGPIKMTRYGKLTIQEAHFSEEQHKEFKENLINHYPVVCADINKIILEIVSIVKNVDPVSLLTIAYQQMAMLHLRTEKESSISFEQVISAQFLGYLQNVIVSVSPDKSDTIEENDFDKLKGLHESLCRNITPVYHMCDAAKRQKEGNFDEEAEEITFIARLFYNFVAGKQYQFLESEILEKLLSVHNEVFQELFAIDVQNFIQAINSIQHSLTKGMIEAFIDLKNFQKDSLDKLFEKIKDFNGNEENIRELMQDVIRENGWQERVESAFGRTFFSDLFDLQKVTNLPIKLLDALSLSPSEDKSFFDDKDEFKGWPFRYYPIRAKPFLKVDAKYYCFNLYNLTDHIYRALYKVIIGLKPSYVDEWQRKQADVSEQYTFELFHKLLPHSNIHKKVWYEDSSEKTKKWCEADGVICFDDNLFIVEVKAGAFSPYSPTTDFEGFQKSINDLIGKPYKQGKRFLKYLESAETVQLFNEDRNVIDTLQLGSFRNVILCCVTLEQLTNLGGKLAELKSIGTEIDITKRPVWSISIDDLRVYVDLIKNPLIFCHYLEQRNSALLQLKNLVVADELDHFGAYLEHNNYAMHFGQLPEMSKLQFHGYRNPLDKYYKDKLLGDNVEPPIQKLPPMVQEIINVLSSQNKKGCSKVASYILDYGGKARDQFAVHVQKCLLLQQQTGKAKIFSMGGLNLSVTCEQDGVHLIIPSNFRNDVLAAMLPKNDNFRILLKLKFDNEFKIYDVDFIFFTAEDINQENLEELKALAKIQTNNRIKNYIIENKKIGRNDQCPCGSGEKYKRCHG